jgi:hypothetical protein
MPGIPDILLCWITEFILSIDFCTLNMIWMQ